MIIEKLLLAEDKKAFVESLDDTNKKVLLDEIDTKTKEAESEYIKQEAIKTKLEEDEKNLMEKLNTMGIVSYEALDTEINKLETELNEELIKYANAIQGE